MKWKTKRKAQIVIKYILDLISTRKIETTLKDVPGVISKLFAGVEKEQSRIGKDVDKWRRSCVCTTKTIICRTRKDYDAWINITFNFQTGTWEVIHYSTSQDGEDKTKKVVKSKVYTVEKDGIKLKDEMER